MTSIGGILGISKSGSFKCGIQTFLTNYFPLTSIFWTTVIGYFLLSLLDLQHAHHLQTKLMSKRWVHLVCWGLPLALTLLPLITDQYGTFDGEDGWCFLHPGSKYPKWTYQFWIIVAFFGWVYLAVFSFFFLTIYVSLKLTRADYPEPRLRDVALKSLRRLVSYPLIILISWCSLTVYILWSTFYPSAAVLSDANFVYISFTVPLFSGTLTSLAFFSFSSEARYTFFLLLGCISEDFHSSTHSLKRNAIQVQSRKEEGDEPEAPTCQVWNTITRHFLTRVQPAPPTQGQIPTTP